MPHGGSAPHFEVSKTDAAKKIYKSNKVVVDVLHCDLDNTKRLSERLVKETLQSGGAGENMKLMAALQTLMATQKQVQAEYEQLDWIMHTHRIKATNEPVTVESVAEAIASSKLVMKAINDDCAILKCLLPNKKA